MYTSDELNLRNHDSVADPTGQAFGVVESRDAAGRVGETKQVGDTEDELSIPLLLAMDIPQKIGGGAKAIGCGKPGVGPLSPVARPDQPFTSAWITG